MHVHALTVENFRALRRARVTLDDTTLLIGENDCGKSSLLEALTLTLDGGDQPPRFESHHFHRRAAQRDAPPAGPIRIEIEFRERQPGEWDLLRGSELSFLVDGTSAGPREAAFEIRADPPAADGRCTVQWRIATRGAGAQQASRDPQAVAALRRLNPLVLLRGGGLLGASARAVPRHATPGTQGPRAAQLAERVESSLAALLTGTAAHPQSAIDEGFAAARELLGGAARHLGGPRHGFREMVAEILGQRGEPLPASVAPAGLAHVGSGAGRIGLLALMAAILRAVPGALPEGAEPIWIVEDPEAQLHPMTLAAVMAMIGRIKWQKVITTQSPDVLAAEPLSSLRRLVRRDGVVREWCVRPRSLSAEDLRRVGYHLRARRGVATFARCWLLVEGETEFWVLPELARIAGHDFAVEGVVCVEFAQCGLRPLIKLARELGIEWHLLADGDRAGQTYVEQALRWVRGEPARSRVTTMVERDIEHCFHAHGYAGVFDRLAGVPAGAMPARRVIERAIDRHSKPLVALELVLAASRRRARPVPPPLAHAIETCVALARGTPPRD